VLDRLLGGMTLDSFGNEVSTSDADAASPLAGLGCGLPLARNYARYFGGDLTLLSAEGRGTDSFIHLPRFPATPPAVPGGAGATTAGGRRGGAGA